MNSPHPRYPGRLRTETGFTLMEVILAITIVSLIMLTIYGTLYAMIDAKQQIEKEGIKAKSGPPIMKLIEQDVSSVWCMNIHNNDVFIGEDNTVNGEAADSIHMITATDSTIVEMSGEEAVRSDLCEVSYRIRANPSNPDYLELYRRQDFHVDDEISEGGRYELLYEHVKSFEVKYYKDLVEDADEYDEWDAKERNRLPAAIEVILTLEIDPRIVGYSLDDMSRDTLEFNRVIFLPAGSELTMAVRPVIPSLVEPEDDATGGGGGGSGGGGKGGKTPEGGGKNPGGKGGGKGDMPGGGFNPGDGNGFDPPDIPDNGGDVSGDDIDNWWEILFG